MSGGLQTPLTEAEEARVEEIASRMDAIAEQIEAGGLEDNAAAALEEEYQKLDREYDELQDRPSVLTDELKAQVGTFLTLAPDGTMKLETSYFSETPIRTGEP